MEWCATAVTTFHCRGGARKGVALPRRPGVPVFKRRQPQGEDMGVPWGLHRFPGLRPLSLPAPAPGVGPCPPGGRDGGLLPILLDAFPPQIPQGRQRRPLVPDLLQGVVPCWPLLPLGLPGQGLACRLSPVVQLRRGLEH
jgi:hypothetical protein